jgi:hypothetical protein
VRIAALVLFTCCSSVERTVPGSSGGADAAGSSGSTGSASSGSVLEECKAADGTRVCGGPDDACRWLEAPECPGYGCTPVMDRSTMQPTNVGVCWADLPDKAADLCFACLEGELCAQRTPDQLVCVSQAACDAVWELGATSACRYSDKTDYTHEPIPQPGFCPAGGEGKICGGTCGACEDYGAGKARCVGRSPLHPFGLCALDYLDGFPGCWLDEGGKLGQGCGPNDLCAVFDVAAGDQPIANRYGTCVLAKYCEFAGDNLPGGVRCFDASGQQVAP